MSKQALELALEALEEYETTGVGLRRAKEILEEAIKTQDDMLALPSNSTALEAECKRHYELGKQQQQIQDDFECAELIRQAKREALLDAAGYFRGINGAVLSGTSCMSILRQLAEEVGTSPTETK